MKRILSALILGLLLIGSNLFAADGDLIVNGNAGVGTTTPAVKLDVNGEIRIGNSSTACSSTIEGSVRYNSTTKVMEYCNGTSWLAFGSGSSGTQYDAYTKLIIHMDGAAGSTTFTDSSVGGKVVTVSGNSQISTSQYKFGAASGYFDGSGDYLTVPDSEDWSFGNEDFTIDFWVRFTEFPPSASPYWGLVQLISQGSGSTTASWSIFKYDNALIFQSYNEAGTKIVELTASLSWSIGVWYHIALVRNNNVFKIYRDGVSVATVANSSTMPNVPHVLTISGDAPHATCFLNGHLDELRISKGIARWTANFTPPTAAY